ncbi:MAG TPA: restriction endonuclease [Dissulfurispiraceae bacterium]|nr:restriction endonuclease [Dissulfurispiraceae bacterium]
MAISVIKASGEPEDFDARKLANSLVRSGAPESVARDIAEKVSLQVVPSFHTKHIFRMAKKMLRQYNRVSGMRYSIKRAIYALGPTGYPFEKYVARILKSYGYNVEVNRMIKGYCVTHEVDVLANRDDRRCVIECKHHANGEKPADVKIALYVHSRFEDIRKAFEVSEHQNSHVHEGWLVTNTRCSADAIKYAECVGLKIVSWRYPEKGSLESLIEEKRLYPVTILPAATRSAVQTLTSRDIILADEVAGMSAQTFVERSGLDRTAAMSIKKEADELCVPSHSAPALQTEDAAGLNQGEIR